MKLPRDLSGAELVRLLGKLGYEPTRQVGSHVRLTRTAGQARHLTVPLHHSLKPKTLALVILHVSEQLALGRDEVLATLFG